MPAPIGPLVGFSLGVLLALLGGSEAARDDDRGRALRLVALFAVVVYAPVCGHFLAFAEDWAFAYLVDGRAVPSALSLLIVVVDAVSVVGGFALARTRTRRSLRSVGTLLAVPAAAAIAFVLLALGRLRVEASFHEFHNDFGTKPIAGGRIGFAVMWMLAMLAAGVVVTARGLRGASRQPD